MNRVPESINSQFQTITQYIKKKLLNRIFEVMAKCKQMSSRVHFNKKQLVFILFVEIVCFVGML